MERAPMEWMVAGLLALAVVSAVAWRARAAHASSAAWRPRIRDDGRMASVLERIAKTHRQPAMAAALVQGDRIAARASVGRTVDGGERRVDLEGRFHIGSTTKGLTAILVAVLVREGRLRYDDTLGALLSEIPMRDEYRTVTVRDLLLHRGGAMPMQDQEREDRATVDRLWKELPARVVDAREQRLAMAHVVLALPPASVAGRQHVYSNVGYALLGLLAERAGGAPFETLMASRVFGPLQMTGARVGGWPASEAEPDQPRGHYVESRGLRAQPLDDTYLFPAWMNPAGGVHCRIEDFARYALESLRGLQGRGALLDQAAYRQIHAPHADVRVREMYGPSLPRLMAAFGDPGEASQTIGYGWVAIPTPDGSLSAGDGSGGTFFARILVYPALDAAFVAATSTGSGAAACSEAIREVTGLAWE